jgi:hypothetical protein
MVNAELSLTFSRNITNSERQPQWGKAEILRKIGIVVAGLSVIAFPVTSSPMRFFAFRQQWSGILSECAFAICRHHFYCEIQCRIQERANAYRFPFEAGAVFEIVFKTLRGINRR